MTVRFAEKELQNLYDDMTEYSRSDRFSMTEKPIMPIPAEGDSSGSSVLVSSSMKIPNATTLKAIQETIDGDVIICRNEEDLFDQLDS